jgi:hypothetical protein
VDTISIIENYGSGLSRGPTCGLGMFTQITKEQAALLKSESGVKADPEQVKPEIEDIPEESD